MDFDRLPKIQDHLKTLYEQLSGEEDAFFHAEEAEKIRIQQKIRKTQKLICEYKTEYIRTLSQGIKPFNLLEVTAQEVVTEIVDEVETLASQKQPNETRRLLLQILKELQKSDTPASAKLKVAIPIIPNLVSYELVGETRHLVKQLFPAFVKIYERVIKK